MGVETPSEKTGREMKREGHEKGIGGKRKKERKTKHRKGHGK